VTVVVYALAVIGGISLVGLVLAVVATISYLRSAVRTETDRQLDVIPGLFDVVEHERVAGLSEQEREAEIAALEAMWERTPR